MNPVTVAIGAVAILYGLSTLLLRLRRPERFGKLEAMKARWGARAGGGLHVIGYTILPIVFGVLTVLSGLAGRSFF